MIENVDTEMAEISVRLLDDAYLAWVNAESECEGTLRAWFDAAGAAAATAYLTYCAALDREEAAAQDLQRLWQVSATCREPLVHGSDTVRS